MAPPRTRRRRRQRKTRKHRGRGLTIDTSVVVPHPTSLAKAKIDELKQRVEFDEEMSNPDKWTIIKDVLAFLLSDAQYLQNSSDSMDIQSAKSNMPKDIQNTRANAQSWANVIDNVLSRLEPSATGGNKEGVVVVRYFMIGCPHCDASEPAWEEFKKEKKYKTEEHEAADEETQTEGVTGFPTYRSKKGGAVLKEHAGALMSPADIKRALDL